MHWGIFFKISFYFEKNSYLTSNWNKLDFLIIITSIIEVTSSNQNLKSLRILRILRPLRTISRIKSLKIMLNAIFSSFDMLYDILVILFFYYTLLAIAGQAVFKGSLK